MRGKRSKAYRKLLKQFELAFNFHQPYQVLVDADLVKDAHRFAMDLPQYLSNTLHGEVKILITQCSMRHLYAQNKEPGINKVIDKAKGFERRRCSHHPEEFPEPLSTPECLGSVVGATNKHRYVVASQDREVRAKMRRIAGVPLVYISRSVMIVSTACLGASEGARTNADWCATKLEPMASATARVVQKGEREKFRAELKEPAQAAGKRKREEDDSDGSDAEEKEGAEPEKKKKKKRRGEKGPNPLAVKKPKKKPQQQQPSKEKAEKPKEDAPSEHPAKKKRKRKQKKTADSDGDVEAQQAAAGSDDE